MTFDHIRDVRDIKFASGDGDHELLGVIDGEARSLPFMRQNARVAA